jgi:hypothetical protein
MQLLNFTPNSNKFITSFSSILSYFIIFDCLLWITMKKFDIIIKMIS